MPFGEGVRHGDLLLTVKLAPHPTFERKGDDLTVDVAVPYTTAALGGQASVPTLKGTPVTIKLLMPLHRNMRSKSVPMNAL